MGKECGSKKLIICCREVPKELTAMAEGGEVALDMEDHSNEDYVAPKQPKVYFTGSGQTLGSDSTAQVIVRCLL